MSHGIEKQIVQLMMNHADFADAIHTCSVTKLQESSSNKKKNFFSAHSFAIIFFV